MFDYVASAGRVWCPNKVSGRDLGAEAFCHRHPFRGQNPIAYAHLKAEVMTSMERRDAWAYGLVGLDVVAVLLWLPVTSMDTFAPFILGAGVWWLLPPAVLVLLGCLGFWTWARAERQHRHQRPLVFLPWTSVLALTPLAFYVWLALLFATFPKF